MVVVKYDETVKQEVLSVIKQTGISQAEAGRKFGISAQTISHWCRVEATGSSSNHNLILENNRLKKELDNAYRLIGKLAARSDRPKG